MPKVPMILDVLRKYGLQDKVGIARLHKHFELSPDEFVVWKVSEERSQSRVLKEKGSPMCFAFDGSDWVPTEFYEGDDIWANLRKDAQFEQWTKEVNEIVK
ncbi:unnamed protein product [Sphagnum balticum]